MKLLSKFRYCSLFLVLFSTSHLAVAQETEVMVRVKAKDAKFIGSSMGGAKVVIKDSRTGKILAEGLTTGSTGNTEKIMETPLTRNTPLSDEKTAGFLAKLKIQEPVLVTVEAYAPGSSDLKSSTQLWVLPEKDITGDGLVLEIPGFIVDVLSPQAHERIGKDNKINITANVIMMCGCPLTAGGLWDANKYEINAVIKGEGASGTTIPMQITDKPSTFEGEVTLTPGNYEVAVYAFDPATGNTGLGKTNFIVN